MSTTYKLRVKLNGSEFFGAGDKEAVKEDYKAFLEAQATQKPATNGSSRGVSGTSSSSGEGSGGVPHDNIEQSILERVFAVNESGQVSMRILPRTERRDADSLILLLYGYKTLGNQPEINSGVLAQAARQSGLQLNRLDYTIATYQQLITEGGLRRGKRYGLNNQGVNHAEQLIRGML